MAHTRIERDVWWRRDKRRIGHEGIVRLTFVRVASSSYYRAECIISSDAEVISKADRL